MVDLFAILPKGEKKTEECKYLGRCPALGNLDFMRSMNAYNIAVLYKFGYWNYPIPCAERAKDVQQCMMELVCKQSGDKHELCPTYQFIEKRKTA